MAVPHRWLKVGISNGVLWGTFSNKKGEPLQVQARLTPLTFACNCSQRSHPCYHALGLVTLLAQNPELVHRAGCP